MLVAKEKAKVERRKRSKKEVKRQLMMSSGNEDD